MNRQQSPSDQRKARYHTEWNDEKLLPITIVRAVATVSNRNPTEIEPLCDAINPDALVTLMTSCNDSKSASVTFSYAGYDVLVQNTGQITLWKSTES
ncbi:HalOD1 output domain-containing protein [Haloarcula sp. JP-L23]|uniref:HalOD1 output domain-containing protein n=1 Tax=Haloarcula sp. JP-L23 TaxID=2716717 RepID=UPI00140EF840|nr:hypothetical protein G9465_22445 [Haloarcula sp. JP-L23]